jgi:serine protease AprX
MTASRAARPLAVPLRGPVGAPDRTRAGLVALALMAATAVATTGAAVPSSAAPVAAPELSRVVVSAVGEGAAGVAAATDAVLAAGGRVLDALPLVGGVAAELPNGAVLAPGLVVAPDRPVSLAGGVPADGPASTVRETLGLGDPADEGRGITVAVVDTGVVPGPDLAGRLTSVDVSGAGPGDGYGHGTFVAGLVAGSGASSDGAYAGVAPGASVLSVRVADAAGSTDLVTVLRGLEVAARSGAQVVNLSLSSYSPLPYQLDPLTVALGTLWDRGTVVVVPAGNDGPDAGTITSPGVHPALLTVGALDEGGTAARDNDTVADFSARGPAPQDVAKPDLTAPGRSLVSLRAPGSVIDATHGATAAVGDDYFKGSGTSFATAVTSGAVAAMLAERALTPNQVKALVMGTAYRNGGLSDPDAAGAGGLDLAQANDAPAPAADAVRVCPGAGKGRGCPGGLPPVDGIPGAPGQWQQLVKALLAEDVEGAASSWSRLSPEARAWVASSWSSLPADLREELVAEWAGRNWAHLTPEEWAALDWAGRNWAASSWSGRNWAGRNWAGRNWADTDDWLIGWDGRNWAGRNWAGRNWAGRNWAGRNWAASSWSGRNWAGRNWADDSWTGRNWAASSWAASSWAATFDR